MGLSGLQRVLLVAGRGHRPEDLHDYGLVSGERPLRHAGDLMSFTWLAEQIHPVLNRRAARPLTADKWLFYRWMAGFGVPVPTTLGLYDPVHGISWDGQRRLRTVDEVVAEVARARPAGLVLKPAGGQQGRGVLVLDEIDHASGAAVSRDGALTTVHEAVAGVDAAGTGAHRGCIVQVPVPAHPVYQELAPWTTNTVRVVTVVDLQGDAHLQVAATLLGRRGSMANNWHAGGVSVGIDLATGALGRGILLGQPGWVEEHPDSGVPFTGRAVPGWEAVVEVCLRAATLLPGTRSVGWDVVVSPEGPVLLEGNEDWDMKLVQVHGRGFLADERIRAQFEAAGAALPSASALSGLRPAVRRKARGLLWSLRR